MNTKIFLVSLAVVASIVTLVLAASVMNQVQFQDVGDTNASGSASVRVSTTLSGLSNVKINFKIKDLNSIQGEVFEAWLVDYDSGYKLSLGSFTTNKNGRSNFKFSQTMVNFGIYDRIVVTSEPLMDEDPQPGAALLVANLPDGLSLVAMLANLQGSNEVPSTNSSATGNGNFVLDAASNTLSYNITYINLINETAAHIHGFAMANETAGILFDLPAGDSKVGVWNYAEDQEDEILAGLTYVNVHSPEFPDGEIRGQIIVA